MVVLFRWTLKFVDKVIHENHENWYPTNKSTFTVYIYQLKRYFRACFSYHDYHDRGLLLRRELMNQEFQIVKLNSSLRNFTDTIMTWLDVIEFALDA